MAIGILLLLLFFLLVRPMEFVPQLQLLRPVPLLTMGALALCAYEIGTNKIREKASPQWVWVLAFFGWSVLSTAKAIGAQAPMRVWATIGMPIVFMFIMMYSAYSFQRLRRTAVVLLGCVSIISAICIHQAQQEYRCIRLPPPNEDGEVLLKEGEIEDRTCTSAHECEMTSERGDNSEYDCEKPGLFGSFTVKGRVRWLGQLEDPNEYSLFVGAVLPILFAYYSHVRKKWFLLLLGPAVVLSLWGVVLSQSRAGQALVSVVFLMYFVRRYGARGFVVAAIMALPVLALGGRSGENADASSAERAQILYHGFDIFKSKFILGAGMMQFEEEMPIPHTAHNSYLLTCAELGLVGGFIWNMLFFISGKIPYQIYKQGPAGLDPDVREFAFAVLCAFIGLAIGLFTLSYAYKQLFFLYLGVSGALYLIVRNQHPEFVVKPTKNDFIAVGTATVVIMSFVWVYGRLKGSH